MSAECCGSAEDAGAVIKTERGNVIIGIREAVVEVNAADQEIERPAELAVEMRLNRNLPGMVHRAVIVGASRGAGLGKAAVNPGIAGVDGRRADPARGAARDQRGGDGGERIAAAEHRAGEGGKARKIEQSEIVGQTASGEQIKVCFAVDRLGVIAAGHGQAEGRADVLFEARFDEAFLGLVARVIVRVDRAQILRVLRAAEERIGRGGGEVDEAEIRKERPGLKREQLARRQRRGDRGLAVGGLVRQRVGLAAEDPGRVAVA